MAPDEAALSDSGSDDAGKQAGKPRGGQDKLEEEDVPFYDGDLPSRGCEEHEKGECKPCNYIVKGNCKKGKQCGFCHYEHEQKRKPRPSKRIRDMLTKAFERMKAVYARDPNASDDDLGVADKEDDGPMRQRMAQRLHEFAEELRSGKHDVTDYAEGGKLDGIQDQEPPAKKPRRNKAEVHISTEVPSNIQLDAMGSSRPSWFQDMDGTARPYGRPEAYAHWAAPPSHHGVSTHAPLPIAYYGQSSAGHGPNGPAPQHGPPPQHLHYAAPPPAPAPHHAAGQHYGLSPAPLALENGSAPPYGGAPAYPQQHPVAAYGGRH